MNSPFRTPTIVPSISDEQQPEVRAGDIYEVMANPGLSCRTGRVLHRGSRLYVIQRTRDVPMPSNEISASTWNWLVRESVGDHVTVWSSLEQCIQRGVLRKVPS